MICLTVKSYILITLKDTLHLTKYTKFHLTKKVNWNTVSHNAMQPMCFLIHYLNTLSSNKRSVFVSTCFPVKCFYWFYITTAKF